MKQSFDSGTFTTNEYASLDCNAYSRVRIQLVKAINKEITLPKMVVIIADNDLMRYFDPEDNEVSKNIGKVLNWLMSEFGRIISAHKEHLPTKAVKPTYPTFIWIETPLHDNFNSQENLLRAKFNKALEMVAQFHDSVYALKLKKIWDEHDGSLFLKEQQRFTFSGLAHYWEAVDNTVKFADTILLQKAERKQAKVNGQTTGKSTKSTGNPWPKQRKQHKPHVRADKFHWTKNKYN